MKYKKKVLEGKYIRLEPLNSTHKEGLIETILDGELWKLFVTIVPPINNLDDFLENANKEYESGFGISYAIVNKNTNKVIGSTRFRCTEFNHKKTEIGFTFLAKTWQKSHVNTEAKLLLLTHAFEEMKFNRVELITDFLNHSSRSAILRLGAKEEGVLRNHVIMPNGRVRNSVIFSIIENEWVGVREHLEFKLRNSRGRTDDPKIVESKG
jgi:RimJ/RimL family protein N-acetyltransferase